MKLLLRVAIWSLAVWLLSIGSARAESVRVIADGAILWTPTGVPVLITTLKAGTLLEVRGRRDQWILVTVPFEATTPGRVGMILATQVEPVDGAQGPAPPPARPTPTPRTAPPPRRQPPPREQGAPRVEVPRNSARLSQRRVGTLPRSFLFASAGYNLTDLHFDAVESFPVLLEQATRTTSYQVRIGPSFEAGGGLGVARHLTVGGVGSWRKRTDQGSVNEQVPSPISYNNPRGLAAESPLRRQEAAGHMQLMIVVRTVSGFQIGVGGGPSAFYVRQAIVSDLNYKETYPYDQITVLSLTTKTQSKVGVGFNAQAQVVIPVTQRLGWQTASRYSRGFLKFGTGDNRFDVLVGGPQVTTGLRLEF